MNVIEELDTAVLELDADGCFRRVNSAAEESLGASRDRLVGMTLDQVTGSSETLLAALEATRTDSRPRRLHDCALPGGRYDCTIKQLDNGHFLLEGHGLDWNQQQRQLDQVEVQTGLMNLLRRNLGHEIRNPLGGIRGAAQMMADELGEQELGTLAHMIMREVDRVDELIKSFWQPSTKHDLYDLHHCLHEALELVGAEEGALAYHLDYDPSIPEMNGDEASIRQLFVNLLKNARQAGAAQLRVRTRVEHGSALLEEGRGTVVRVDLEDDGDGVPEQLRPLLFLPMVTSRREGTGLGLALVQQIAADNHGLVTYEPLREGSRFSLHLPVSCGNGEETAP